MGKAGPGAQTTVQEGITPTLDGASEYEYVTILNPLTDDFYPQVAQDIPVNMPFNIGRDASGKTNQTTLTERDAAQTYGLSLKNPDFQARKHIINEIEIKSGRTINLKGNEAQVVVRQLVNEILQREGKKRLLSDPTLRKEVEDRIIINRGSVQELMDTSLTSSQQQATNAVKQSNEVHDEEPFPGLEPNAEPDATGSGGFADTDNTSQKRAPGRPKKA